MTAASASLEGRPARWWMPRADGRLECTLCPRRCKLSDGQRGFCVVRRRRGAELVSDSYGRASGFCADPIEKKPLYHFYPGCRALSFGAVGCNLGCRYCQNWGISKAESLAALLPAISPGAVADLARRHGCRAVAFTYNDPVISAEFVIDVAHACRERGIAPVAVTAGYIEPGAREEFFDAMDAANVDLKAFSDAFYRRKCLGRLQPVLETLEAVAARGRPWLEVTTLLIPGLNDGADEVARAAEWFVAHLGAEVPWHFTAFHPDFRMLDVPRTPPATLAAARSIALSAGVRHVYTGNVRDPGGSATHCAGCGAVLVERNGFEVTRSRLEDGRCPRCGRRLAGVFSS